MTPEQKEYIDYLDSRIKAIQDAHTAYQKSADQASDEEISNAYNSISSGLHDTVVELKRVKNEYKRVYKITEI